MKFYTGGIRSPVNWWCCSVGGLVKEGSKNLTFSHRFVRIGGRGRAGVMNNSKVLSQEKS